MSEIREPGFSLDLPGMWEPEESDQPGSLVYRETAGSGVVTVMLLAIRPAYSIADRSRLHTDYMQHRSKYERGQTPSLEQSEPIAQRVGTVIEGSWNAEDGATGRHQLHRVVLSGDVLVDFCYEASDSDGVGFDDRAALILDSAVVTAESSTGDR